MKRMHLIGTLHTHTLVLSHIETYKYIKRHAILSITIKLCQTINMLYISIYRCVCVCQGPQDPQVSSFNASNRCRSLGPPTGRTPLNPPASHGALHPHIPCDANSHGPGKWTSTRLYMMKTILICHSVGSTVVLCRYERMAWPLRGRHLAENTWKPLGLDNCSFGILLQGVGSL